MKTFQLKALVKLFLHDRLCTFKLGLYQFSHGIITTIITLVLLYIMSYMGVWQYEKGQYREHLENTIKQRKDLAPVAYYLLPENQADWKYLPVSISGRFDNEHQFLHDNRIIKGRTGYNVYTPFRSNSGHVVLVNRGWLPQGRTRENLPDTEVTQEMVTITGLVDSLPSKGVILSAEIHQHTSWPRVLQYLDSSELSKAVGYELQDRMVWMAPGTEHGYYREYPALNLQSAKNFGYAFQWFAMCAALIVIYLVVNTSKQKSTDNH